MVSPAYPDSVSSVHGRAQDRLLQRRSTPPRRPGRRSRLGSSAIPFPFRYAAYLHGRRHGDLRPSRLKVRPVPYIGRVTWSPQAIHAGRRATLMRAKGIRYDTGFSFDASNRRPFDHAVVRRELQIIRDDLHCTAVRVFGNDPDRLDFAANHAADLGLEVWFSPFTYQLTPSRCSTSSPTAPSARSGSGERGAELVFVTGAELSLFNSGFLPGESLRRAGRGCWPAAPRARAARPRCRLASTISSARRWPWSANGSAARSPTRRSRSSASTGRRSTSSSVDAYRLDGGGRRVRRAPSGLWSPRAKPVAITEFGCASHRGAADRGARGGEIVEYEEGIPVRLNGDYARDEAGTGHLSARIAGCLRRRGRGRPVRLHLRLLRLAASRRSPHDLDMAS